MITAADQAVTEATEARNDGGGRGSTRGGAVPDLLGGLPSHEAERRLVPSESGAGRQDVAAEGERDAAASTSPAADSRPILRPSIVYFVVV